MKYIEGAIQSISDALRLMNEDRAKIEKHQQMFVIHRLIENCPVRLF